MVQYQLAVSIELAPLALSWGNEVGFSLSANKANAKPLAPAKSFLFENFLKFFFEAGLSSESSKKRPASRNGPAGRRNVL